MPHVRFRRCEIPSRPNSIAFSNLPPFSPSFTTTVLPSSIAPLHRMGTGNRLPSPPPSISISSAFTLPSLPDPLNFPSPTPTPIPPSSSLQFPLRSLLLPPIPPLLTLLSPIIPSVDPPVTDPTLPTCCTVPLFRPYVAKVPWHGGPRALLSRLFPRYGHYCGPNWSSGKEAGSMLWDRRPIDWLDHCCYCHDIGYDTHDQAKLLKADLAFLECLERPRMATKGGATMSIIYRAMCIAGLRSFLIPYRTHLVRLQSGPSLYDYFGNMFAKIPSIKIGAGNQKVRF